MSDENTKEKLKRLKERINNLIALAVIAIYFSILLMAKIDYLNGRYMDDIQFIFDILCCKELLAWIKRIINELRSD